MRDLWRSPERVTIALPSLLTSDVPEAADKHDATSVTRHTWRLRLTGSLMNKVIPPETHLGGVDSSEGAGGVHLCLITMLIPSFPSEKSL